MREARSLASMITTSRKWVRTSVSVPLASIKRNRPPLIERWAPRDIPRPWAASSIMRRRWREASACDICGAAGWFMKLLPYDTGDEGFYFDPWRWVLGVVAVAVVHHRLDGVDEHTSVQEIPFVLNNDEREKSVAVVDCRLDAALEIGQSVLAAEILRLLPDQFRAARVFEHAHRRLVGFPLRIKLGLRRVHQGLERPVLRDHLA